MIRPLNSLNKSSTPVQKSLMTSSRARETCGHRKPSLFIPVHTPSCLPLQLQLCCTCGHCYEEMREHRLITKAAEKDVFISLSAILVLEFAYCGSKHHNLQTYFQLGSVAAKEGPSPRRLGGGGTGHHTPPKNPPTKNLAIHQQKEESAK